MECRLIAGLIQIIVLIIPLHESVEKKCNFLSLSSIKVFRSVNDISFMRIIEKSQSMIRV